MHKNGQNRGRPNTQLELYEKYGSKICSELEKGRSLSDILRDDGMPSPSTVFRWLNNDIGNFREEYARAREWQATIQAEEIIAIADNVDEDAQAIAKAKLQIDTRKWVAARMAPKHWGSKSEVLVSSKSENMASLAELFKQAAEQEGGNGK